MNTFLSEDKAICARGITRKYGKWLFKEILDLMEENPKYLLSDDDRCSYCDDRKAYKVLHGYGHMCTKCTSEGVMRCGEPQNTNICRSVNHACDGTCGSEACKDLELQGGSKCAIVFRYHLCYVCYRKVSNRPSLLWNTARDVYSK
jgi:hypothetical protein